MDMVKVSSSNIDSVGFSEDTNTLRVKFSNGVNYDYSNVSKDIFNGLKSADSVGRYFLQNIKGNYSFSKV